MDLSKSLLFLLSITGCCVAQSVLPDGPVDAVQGRNVTLTTLFDKIDYLAIIWNFNDGVTQVNIATLKPSGVVVKPIYQGRVWVNQTNGYLTLGSLKTEDSGDYSITVLPASESETKTGEIKLRVLKPVSDVVITSNLPEAIEYNSTVVLNCSAKGSFLKFTWTNGSTPVVPDDVRLTLKQDAASSALTITGVLRTDLVGPIYCTAANNLETFTSLPFNLTVYYGPDKVTMSPEKTPQFIRSDSNFNLSCSATSNPAATFTWYNNQQVIPVTGTVLTLQAIKDNGLGKQLGNFTCRASNAKTLRVVPSPALTFAVMDALSGASITGPTATLIAGNSSANLSCQATAGKVTDVSWWKGEKPLTETDRLVFSDDKRFVVINPLQKEDRGEYRCQLKNPVSDASAAYNMVVNFGPEQTKVAGVSKAEENHAVTLTCSAESFPPANYTWKFNGSLTAVRTNQYTINQPVITNSGIYTCEAFNPVTGKTSTYAHTLEVKAEGTLDPGLSDGAIAGIVIAVLVAIAAAIAVTIYCRQKVPVESPY